MTTSIILGMGTGRCGTTSLAGLLGRQPGAEVTHVAHRFRWRGDVRKALGVVESFPREGESQLLGDVSPFWLPYAAAIAEQFPDVRFVCLVRPLAEYVESWLASQPHRNAWCQWQAAAQDWAYPHFGVPDVEWSARQYWSLYHAISEKLADDLPGRFRVWPTAALNSEEGQCAILDFCGVDEPVLSVGLRLNRRGTPWNERFKE